MTGQQSSWWSRVSGGGRVGFDKAWNLVDKLGAPVNKLSNKLGSEAFWPTTLDKESDKAARILRSFCSYQECKGLAIFTTMRTGLWVSGAGGSGVLVGRTADGSWSPPSGIMLHTAGLGFLVGALDAFSKIRCTLGGEVSAVAGPVGAGGLIETEIHKRQAPIFTYLKSRGFYAGVQIDGMSIREAGTQKRASWEQFNFQPAPTSPIFNTFSRQSLDKNGNRNRSSSNSTFKTTSNLSQTPLSSASTAVEQPKRVSVTRSMSDMCTQTDFAEPVSPRVGSFRSRQSSLHEIAEDSNVLSEPRPKIDRNPSSRSTRSSPRRSSFRSSHRRTDSGSDSRSDSPPQQATPAKPENKDIAEESFDDADEDGDDTADEAIIEEPVVHSVQKANAPQFISRARPVVINAEPGAQRPSSTELSSPEESPLKANKPQWSVPSSPDKLSADSPGFGDPSPSPASTYPWYYQKPSIKI
ncbi:unnamed protein product [Aureobasidium pullulans]|nr:unnamed protein product [Aureobasidium pullulans]